MDPQLRKEAASAATAPPGTAADSTRWLSDETTKQFFNNVTEKRVHTPAFIARVLKEQYPNLELVINPAGITNLLAYAASGEATCTRVEEPSSLYPSHLEESIYLPPSRRIDGQRGQIASSVLFAKYLYKWKGDDFIVYHMDGRGGTGNYPELRDFYILTTDKRKANELIVAAGLWSYSLHDEIWVFDQGFWQKSPELFNSIRHASWDSVILNPDMKKAIIDDHLSFFASRDTYSRLKVPWKRGIIYHGPPGNGKTISIKATMHTLYSLKSPVPSLYVRSLKSPMGPERSIMMIFERARQYAPCYLIFEDLDSIVSDDIRSYFLNEVDGLKSNDGIFMVGSTNHLDRLDPGISKRPSRFDRKYYFPDPDMDERVAYCQFWQSKLASNKDIDFPDKLCRAVAGITDGFSFAYIQEAFVAALLAIARRAGTDSYAAGEELAEELSDGWIDVSKKEDKDLDQLILWVEIKKQIEILREGMGDGKKRDGQN